MDIKIKKVTKENFRKKYRCKNCNYTDTYLRADDTERKCRKCGHVEKLKKGETE